MMRQLLRIMFTRPICMAIALAMLSLGMSTQAQAQAGTVKLFAVVPTHIIYPGEQISQNKLEEVEVTNPNLRGDYAQSIGQVAGLITKRTLLPGHAIYISALHEPFAVSRGKPIQMIYDDGTLRITASGLPLSDGLVGDVIPIRNIDSGITVSGLILKNGSIRVLQK